MDNFCKLTAWLLLTCVAGQVSRAADATVRGGYPAGANPFVASPQSGVAAAITYGEKGDADTGVVTVRFDPRKFTGLMFFASGYPDGKLLRYELRTSGGRSMALPVTAPGDKWTPIWFELPAGWHDEGAIFLRAIDESRSHQGWLGIGVGPMPGVLALLARLKAAGLAIVLLGLAAAVSGPAFLARGTWFHKLALALIVLGLWSMAVFFAALVFTGPWYYGLALVAFAAGALSWIALAVERRGRELCQASAVPLGSVAVLAVVTGCYVMPLIVAGHGLLGPDPLAAAQNHYFSLPVDNHIPWFLASAVANDTYTSPLFGDWLGSDRPPLQSGFILLMQPAFWWLSPPWFAFVASCAAQGLWIAGAVLLLEGAGFGLRAAKMALVTASFSGVVLLNGIFTWPKLMSGGFLLAAMGVLLQQLGSNKQKGAPFLATTALSGALAGFALQCHGSAVFAVIPFICFLLFRTFWRLAPAGVALRKISIFTVCLVALQLPWMMWQKVGDPPGNRLIKWHIGGAIAIDERGTLETILESYRSLRLREYVEGKWANLRAVLYPPDLEFTPWFCLHDRERAMQTDFSGSLAAASWALPAMLALGALLVVGRRSRRLVCTALARAAPVLVWTFLSVAVWLLLMFIPGSTINHQGPMNLSLVWLLLAGATLGSVAPWSWLTATILQAGGVFWIYLGTAFDLSSGGVWLLALVLFVLVLLAASMFPTTSPDGHTRGCEAANAKSGLLRTRGVGKTIKLFVALVPVSAVTVILLAKFWHIQNYGNITPFWDQWDAEAAKLYKPWVDGTFSLASLLEVHNEHRIFTTRILHLGLFELMGRSWNPIAQMHLNAVLHVAAIILFAALASAYLPVQLRPFLWIFSAAMAALPFGWENMLAGFQTQFYLLLLLSLALIGWSMSSKFGRLEYSLSLATAVLLALTMASGSLTVLSVAMLLLFRKLIFRDDAVPWSLVCLLSGIAAVGIGSTPSHSGHEGLKAGSVLQFVVGVGKALAWPLQPDGVNLLNSTLPLLMQLPLLIALIASYLGGRGERKTFLFLSAIAFWFGLQVAALAYGRGAGGLSSRHLDILCFGVMANFAALLMLWRMAGRRFRLVLSLLSFLWIGALVSGVAGNSQRLAGEIRSKSLQSIIQQQNVRGYLLTGDETWLHEAGSLEIPYPSAGRLQGLLDDQTIRGFLPRELWEARAVPGKQLFDQSW